jgi:hypothetical protein
MSPAANAIRPLRYHAHVAFRQAVFYLPVLLLILRKTNAVGVVAALVMTAARKTKSGATVPSRKRGVMRVLLHPTAHMFARQGFMVTDRLLLTHHIFRLIPIKPISHLL